MKNIYVIYLYKCDSPMYMRRMSVSCWRYGLRWSGTDDFLWMRCFALWLLSCGGGRPCLPSGRTRAGLLRPVRQVEASFGSEVRTLIMECKTWSLTWKFPYSNNTMADSTVVEIPCLYTPIENPTSVFNKLCADRKASWKFNSFFLDLVSEMEKIN